MFNNEVSRWVKEVRVEGWAQDRRLKRAFLINRSATNMGDPEISDGETMWSSAENSFKGGKFFDISDPNWKAQYSDYVKKWGQFDFVGIIDHGTNSDQWFGGPAELTPNSENWATITSGVKVRGAVGLFGCNVAGGNGVAYVEKLALQSSSKYIAVFAGSTPFRHRPGQFEAPGVQWMSQYQGANILKTISYSYRTQID